MARIDNGKNFLNSNVSPTCPHNMASFGVLTAIKKKEYRTKKPQDENIIACPIA